MINLKSRILNLMLVPFHCKLMKKATDNMKSIILNLKFNELKNHNVKLFRQKKKYIR